MSTISNEDFSNKVDECVQDIYERISLLAGDKIDGLEEAIKSEISEVIIDYWY
jgi:hypothetical protein